MGRCPTLSRNCAPPSNHGAKTMKLPFKEVAAALQDGVGHLMRQAGLELMQLIMEEEVRQLAGECCQRREPGQHYRWGGRLRWLVWPKGSFRRVRPTI